MFILKINSMVSIKPATFDNLLFGKNYGLDYQSAYI